MREKIAEKVKEDGGWRSMLQSASLDCPRCKQRWLILKVDRTQPYTCKGCGHSLRLDVKDAARKKAASG